MRNRFALGPVLAQAVVFIGAAARSGAEDGPPLAHRVLSTLKDLPRLSRDRAVALCDMVMHLVIEAREAEEPDLEPRRYQQFIRVDRGPWSKGKDLDSYPIGLGW